MAITVLTVHVYNKLSNVLCDNENDNDNISIPALNDLPSIVTKFGLADIDTYSLCSSINSSQIKYI